VFGGALVVMGAFVFWGMDRRVEAAILSRLSAAAQWAIMDMRIDAPRWNSRG
jgi:hypothetical protein